MRFYFILFLLFISFSSGSQTALEIIRKSEQKMRSGSSKAEVSISTIRPKWQRSMNMSIWAIGNDYSMILINSPAKEKGIVFLKRNREAWNYVPSIERTIKLPPSMMSQSWMGTDFTNDDLVQESSQVRDYTHQKLQDTSINGMQCWKLLLTPKPDAPVVWGKLHVFIDKENYIPMLTKMYDEDDYLVNTMIASNIKVLGGKTLASKLELIPADKPGHKTIMEYLSLEFDIPLEEEFFTTQNMKRLRTKQ